MDNQDDDSEWAEAISISYRGHGITMSATLSAKQGLKAESATDGCCGPSDPSDLSSWPN